jgi:4-hydroxy-tetrahydrodipicolinate synthase
VRPSPAAAAERALRDRVRGAWTALVTPFRRGRLDRAALRRLVLAQVEAGVSGLCPAGTTGESPTIGDAEYAPLVETVVDAAGGRVPVVPGAGSNDTRRAVALVRLARKAGADAALAAAPPYNRPSQEGLYRHFRAMADEGGLPLLLYHIPGRTGVSIDVDTIARLERSGGIVGLKESQGNVDRLPRLREACDVPVLCGDDALTLAMVACGARGVVSVASNVAPAEVVALVEHALAGRRREAVALDDRLAPLVRALFLESNPSPVKAALRLLGRIPSAEVRLPLVAAGPATVAALKTALSRLRRGD